MNIYKKEKETFLVDPHGVQAKKVRMEGDLEVRLHLKTPTYTTPSIDISFHLKEKCVLVMNWEMESGLGRTIVRLQSSFASAEPWTITNFDYCSLG